MTKYILALVLTFVTTLALYSQSEEGVRVFSGQANAAQTGSTGTYWVVSLTGFNDPGGLDGTNIAIGDYIEFNTSGKEYQLQITLVVTSTFNSATVRVSRVGITGISSVPTGQVAVSRRTVNFGFTPSIANISGNDNQIKMEYTMYKIDSLLKIALDYNVFSTSDTALYSPSGKTPTNGDFIIHEKLGAIGEKKNNFWQFRTLTDGELVRDDKATTIAYGSGTVTMNGSLNRRFYVLIDEDVTFADPTNIELQDGTTYMIEVENNTDEGQTINWSSATFRCSNNEIAMPSLTIGAFSKRLFTFKVIAYEIPILQSCDDIFGQVSSSGWYVPTITKSVSSDTIVTVYACFYERNGNVGTLAGKVLLNNLTSTISSSFRISMPAVISTNFTDTSNDVAGVVNSHKIGVSPTYNGGLYADTTNEQVTVTYDTDGSNTTRQLVEFVAKFKIQ